jgi:hypothetical protein
MIDFNASCMAQKCGGNTEKNQEYGFFYVATAIVMLLIILSKLACSNKQNAISIK